MAAAGEVHREHGVPADERDRERPAPGEAPGEEGGAEGGGRRERLVRPRGNRVRVARDDRERLGGDREGRPVDARRVEPVAAHVRQRRVVRELLRRVGVRVPAAARADPAVRPVRPGVGREEQRRRERDELDRGGEDDHGPERGRRAADQQQCERRRPRRPRSGARGRTGPCPRRCRRAAARAASRAARRARRRPRRARGRPTPADGRPPHGCVGGFACGGCDGFAGAGVVVVAVVSVAVVSVVGRGDVVRVVAERERAALERLVGRVRPSGRGSPWPAAARSCSPSSAARSRPGSCRPRPRSRGRSPSGSRPPGTPSRPPSRDPGV